MWKIERKACENSRETGFMYEERYLELGM